MSQTHIFNFFPGSFPSGRILKTLSLFASREKNTYVPTNQIWLNRLYFQISNSRDKTCLTVNTRDTNDFGPGKFRTRADNVQGQHCYFNRSNTDSRFKRFLTKRVTQQHDRPVFSIVEQNYFLANEQPYKSSDVLTSLSLTAAADGRVNETGQQTVKKKMTDPRLKEEADEMDQWMQQSQPPLSDRDYSSTNEEEEETKDEETKEIVGEGETEKNHDFNDQ